MYGGHSGLQPNEIREFSVFKVGVKLVQLEHVSLVDWLVHVLKVHDYPRIVLKLGLASKVEKITKNNLTKKNPHV